MRSSLLMGIAAVPLAALAEVCGTPAPLPADVINPLKDFNATNTPKNIGVVLFQAFDMIDIFGPLDALQFVARSTQLNLFLLAATMKPVTTAPWNAAQNAYNSSFWPTINPTHTFDQDPDLDFLLIPGGAGVRNPDLAPELAYIARTVPKLRHNLFTVCTGSGLAARAGVLDGKRATTNKGAFAQMQGYGPKVKWVSPARWVVDGNIWTSSGVASGIDMIMAYIEATWGADMAAVADGRMEFIRTKDRHQDPFAAIWGVPPTGVDEE